MTHRAAALALDLEQVVAKSHILRAWQKSVRTGLRSQTLPDLHDHLDFHRNIDGIATRICADVCAGRYRPAAPEFVTQEKRDGIARRMAVPDPADALVLQCIVDALEPQLKGVQPTDRAYYSRSHMPPDVDRVDGTFAYPWWVLWPEFQEKIWQFAESHEFVVTTDIANYFDSIPLTALRNAVAANTTLSENVLNLLFFLLEALVWRPYFMPHSGVGLPQINFDAPRLLAHAYLFHLDDELNHRAPGAFVRWMDDIDVGVPSREAGKALLRSLQIVLNSQGLQLNSNKTRILSAQETIAHFCVQDNRAVTIIENSITNGVNTPATVAKEKETLRSSYRRFCQKRRAGHWEKVQKRYLNLFGKLNDPRLSRELPGLLQEHSALRGAVFLYLSRLGFSAHRFAIVESFTKSGHCADDASFFEVVSCMIAWRIPNLKKLKDRVLLIAEVLNGKSTETPSFSFGAALILLTKYASQDELSDFVLKNRSTWERSAWASRQVAAVTPRLSPSANVRILEALQNSGLLQGLQVWANLDRMRAMARLDRQLSSYLKRSSAAGGSYPLGKILIARTVLGGSLVTEEKNALRQWYAANLSDVRLSALLKEPS